MALEFIDPVREDDGRQPAGGAQSAGGFEFVEPQGGLEVPSGGPQAAGGLEFIDPVMEAPEAPEASDEPGVFETLTNVGRSLLGMPPPDGPQDDVRTALQETAANTLQDVGAAVRPSMAPTALDERFGLSKEQVAENVRAQSPVRSFVGDLLTMAGEGLQPDESEVRKAREELGFFYDLSAGGSSIVPYFLLGAAGGPMAATAFGMVQGRGELERDARESGADEAAVARAGDWGELLGTLQGLPLEAGFGRLGRRVGPQILREALQSTPSAGRQAFRALGRSTAAGATEAVQESLLFELPKNLVARDFVGYDPDRDPWRGFTEAATTGFTVGGLANMLVEGVAGRRLATRRIEALGDEAQERSLDMPYFVERMEDLQSAIEPERTYSAGQLHRLADEEQLTLRKPKKDAPFESEVVAGPERELLLEIADNLPEGGIRGADLQTAIQSRTLALQEVEVERPTRVRLRETPRPVEIATKEKGLVVGKDFEGKPFTVKKQGSNKWELVLNEGTELEFRQDFPTRRMAMEVVDPDTTQLQFLGPEVEESGNFVRRYDAPMARPGRREDSAPFYFGHVAGTVGYRDGAGGAEGGSTGFVRLDEVASELYTAEDRTAPGRFVQDTGTEAQRLAELEERTTDFAGAMRDWFATFETSDIANRRIQRNAMIDHIAQVMPEMPVGRLDNASDQALAQLADGAFTRLDDARKRLRDFSEGRRRAAQHGTWQRALVREELKRAAKLQLDEVLVAESQLSKDTIDWALAQGGRRLRGDAVNGPAESYIRLPVPEALAHPAIRGGTETAPQVRQMFEGFRRGLRGINAQLKGWEEQDVAHWHKGVEWGMNLTQLVRRFPRVEGLQKYYGEVQRWWVEKMRWTAQADERIVGWRQLGGKRRRVLSDLLLEVAVKSEAENRRVTDEELVDIARRIGADSEVLVMFQRIQDDFAQVRTELKEMLLAQVDRDMPLEERPVDNPKTKADIEEQFAQLDNRNYFPFARFGDHVVQVFDGKGALKFRSQHETKRAAQDMVEVQKGKLNQGWKVTLTKMRKEQDTFSGMTPALKTKLMTELSLDEEQKQKLSQILVAMSPAESFAKNMLHRKGTPGFTQDAMRAYADYFRRFAGHMARMKHRQAMVDAIAEVQNEAFNKADAAGSTQSLTDLANWLDEHQQYLFDPGTEWTNLRAAGFLWYLGLIPKSAAVNLTQPVIVTFPYLAAQFGDGQAGKELAQAYADATTVLLSGETAETRIPLPKEWGGELKGRRSRLAEELQEALTRAVREGFIDESLASELAAAATGTTAEHWTPTSFTGSMGRKGARAAIWMFHTAEKVNRRVAFIAAFRLAHKRIGRPWALMSPEQREEVFQAAKDAVVTTQYEYARWNRPKFMRGRKSAVFLFWNYIQNTLHFYHKEPGRVRALLILGMLGGLTGLPFAEDFADLLDALFTQFPELKKKLGLGDEPMTDLRHGAREYLNDVTNDERMTDMLLHGASRYYGFGAAHLAEAAGYPIPQVDLSGSLSMGDVVPGSDFLRSLAMGADASTAFLKTSTDVGGALFAIPVQFMKAAFSKEPDQWKRWERALPPSMKNLSKASRWLARGEELNPLGHTIAVFDYDDPLHMAEIAAQAAGWSPTRVRVAQDKGWATYEHARFYSTQRQILLKKFDKAIRDGDAELKKKVRAEIRKYNATVPHSALKLGPATITESVMQRAERRARGNLGLPPTDNLVPLYRDVQKAYPDFSTEGRKEIEFIDPVIEDL